MRELAISQDIDPDSLVNDLNEAQIYAEILKGLQNAQQGTGSEGSTPNQQPTNMDGSGGVPQGATQPNEQGIGNGTIGIGTTPVAGEGSFTGNPPQSEE